GEHFGIRRPVLVVAGILDDRVALTLLDSAHVVPVPAVRMVERIVHVLGDRTDKRLVPVAVDHLTHGMWLANEPGDEPTQLPGEQGERPAAIFAFDASDDLDRRLYGSGNARRQGRREHERPRPIP